MDDATKRLHDTMVEDELSRGFRVKAIPNHILKVLETARQDDPAIPLFTTVRFSKLTPRQKALAAEHVMKRYNEDLLSDAYLTFEQLRDINIKRGSWSEQKDKRMEELTEQSTAEMRNLYLAGFDQRENWVEELNGYCEEFKDKLQASGKPEEEITRLTGIFFRWLNYDIAESEAYAAYAAEQGLETYSPGRDYVVLLENSVDEAMQDLVGQVDELKFKIRQLKDIITLREELNKLQEEKGKMFANSVEARRDRVEQMAQMYYGIQRANEEGRPVGPLAESFDKFWDYPDKAIEWLQVESYFFYEGIPEASRGFLEQWGFTPAEPVSGSQPASDESPAPPNAKNDSPAPETTAAPSLALATATS